MSTIDTGGLKRAESEVKPERGLTPVNSKWQAFRRWMGIYTTEEKEVITYAQRLKQETISVLSRKKAITKRPDWMRYEDYKKLRELQNNAERKNPRKK